MINRSKPNAKVQGTQGPMNAQAYLKQLEDLLKRNTGTGLFVGQDTSSNIPMYLPGKVANPTGLSETPSTMQYGNGMTQPTPVQRKAPEVYPEPNQVDVPEFTEEPITIEDFLTQFEQAYNAPENQPSFGDPQLEGVMTTADGGTMLGDGTIVYDDGTIRQGDPNAYAIASDVSGGVRYSDGSLRQTAPEGIASLAGDRERIRYSDGTARYGNYQYGEGQPDTQGGIQGLISGIFGQDRTITQPYGNINPIEPTPGNVNYGTDIRTKDLAEGQRELKLPVGAEVVQVLYDDGTQFGDRSGHQGYGNSILVRLATGEMLRFSHMSQMIDVEPGYVIDPGETFGIPGTTGNTQGEHLDLEYYDQSGQISNPASFSGFTNPQGTRTPLPGQPAPGTLDRSFQPEGQTQQSQEQISKPVQQDSGIQQEYKPFQTIKQAGQEAGQNIGNVFSTAKESVKPMSPERQELGQNINELGAKAGLPEMFAGEVASGQVTPGQALSYNIEKANLTPRIDTGLSELSRGDFKGAKTNFLDTVNRVGARLSRLPGEIANEVVKPAYADDGSQKPFIESLGKNLKGAADSIGGYASAKAGEGIKALSQAGVSGLENVFRPQPSISKRAVGDVSGTGQQTRAGQFSSLMDAAPSMSDLARNDVSDPFFKLGGGEMYKQFLKPNAKDLAGGALTLDLFNEDFYKDLGNISSVFGGSKDLGAATEKYVDFEKTKYQPMSKMGYSDEYDSGSIDAYNRQVDEYNNSLNSYFDQIRSSTKGQQSIFTPLPTSANRNIFASSGSKASSPVMPSANFSLNAPKTSMASASLRKSFASPAKLQMSSASNPRAANYQPQMSKAPKASSSPAKLQMSSASNPKAANYRPQMSRAPKVSSPAKLQMSSATDSRAANYRPQMSKAPAPQSKPKSNVFSKVTSAIKNVFRR